MEAYQRNDFGRLCYESMRELLVVVDEIADIDIAVVLLEKRVLLELVPIQSVSNAPKPKGTPGAVGLTCRCSHCRV